MLVRKIFLLICLGLGLLLAACAGGPALSKVDNSVSLRVARPVETPTAAGAPYLYSNVEGHFSLNLPGGWTASQARPTAFGHLYLFSPARPGGEDISVLIGKPEIESADAALAYLCPDCPAQALVVQPVTLGGRPARQVSLAGGADTPDLVWYLVEQNGRVLVFTLHASSNTALYAEILQTLRFDDPH